MYWAALCTGPLYVLGRSMYYGALWAVTMPACVYGGAAALWRCTMVAPPYYGGYDGRLTIMAALAL
jgi:hypothetical protein